ncbi:hypothetical protein C2S51_002925 [Perilla frutescens var. frutescens]|nr:hypothetical protein C2S51_002925 [Perilla frutescens var. frutescens]
MARRIGEKVKEEKLFKVVMMVRVGPSSDLKRIAYEISDYLSVRFEGGDFVARANELLSKLIMQERVLIILDDVREFLDLERIGIPLQKHNGSYKIMITSRFSNVCSAMGCNTTFTVQALTKEDFQILFIRKFGNSIGSSGFHFSARFVVYEHKVLPLAPAVSGRVIKEKSKLWRPILAEKRAMPHGSTLQPLDIVGASSSHKRITVDVLVKGAIKVSDEILETSINLQKSLRNRKYLKVDIWDSGDFTNLSSLMKSRIWSRLVLYVISTPEELKCRYQESLIVSFPAVNADEYFWQFRGAMNLDLPGLTSLIDWMCAMLRSAEYLCLNGDGSKNAVDELIPDGFKFLKQLDIGHSSTMEYLVDVVPANGLFPSLESLCLEDLPLLKGMFNSQLPVGMFRELRNLKLYRLPALLHVCRSQTQGFSFYGLRSIQISHCPKLRCLFSLSMAWNMMQLEEIRIEYCEMMEEIFSKQKHEDGKISDLIQFSKLNHLVLDTLPHLTDFCKNVRLDFPQLSEMRLQSLRKFRIFCPADSDLPLEGNGSNESNDKQVLFHEKVQFVSLKKLEISELQSMISIWSHQTSLSLFSGLEVLVVISCDVLIHLFSHSIAKVLVQLEHLTIEDCCMMQEVIANDGEAEKPEINECLFPRLRKLELRRLPILKSFCHVMNDLELPSLEDLTLYDCQGMKEFSGGKLNMPVLRCVRKDHLIYRIDGVNYSVQHLFNEKHLFIHHLCPLPSQYPCQEKEDVMRGEPILTHPQMSSQASGGNRSADLLRDIDAMNLCLISNQNIMKEDDAVDSLDSCWHGLGEKRRDEGASMFHCGTIDGEQIEKMNDEAQSTVFENMELGNKRYLEDSILFCSVFPLNYEFTKDILVWQWIAGGLIELREDETSEEVFTKCFDILLEMDYIVPSGHDHFVDQLKYKFGDKMTIFLQKQLLEPKFGKYLDSNQSDKTKVEHLSLTFKNIDRAKLDILKQYSHLRTLVICDCYEVDHLPSDLFLELKTLENLNLSRTNIVELPGSVENLKELRFLDMSGTPIGWLPETICCFSYLYTLKLDGCFQLEGLPKCTSKLINLRHLILDVVRQLQSMPSGMGKLSNLRTLSAFLVDEHDGGCVRELKNMNKLRGTFRLLNLENVGAKEEASEACLSNKVDLRKIELQWSDLQDEKNPCEEEILESLQPPVGIQELKILFYSGGVLPSWIIDPSFSELVSIILYKCRYCCSLPSLGELPSLKSLSIIENNEVVEINSLFFRKQRNQSHAAFPKLEKLSFDSMSKLKEWTGLENGDFPFLRCLIIEYCPKFLGVPFLSHLNSLVHLEISYCPELISCGLPQSLESLMIKESPQLKARCCDEQWEARVPTIYIDNQKV